MSAMLLAPAPFRRQSEGLKTPPLRFDCEPMTDSHDSVQQQSFRARARRESQAARTGSPSFAALLEPRGQRPATFLSRAPAGDNPEGGGVGLEHPHAGVEPARPGGDQPR